MRLHCWLLLLMLLFLLCYFCCSWLLLYSALYSWLARKQASERNSASANANVGESQARWLYSVGLPVLLLSVGSWWGGRRRPHLINIAVMDAKRQREAVKHMGSLSPTPLSSRVLILFIIVPCQQCLCPPPHQLPMYTPDWWLKSCDLSDYSYLSGWCTC